ncbi:adenylate/guanylate cyclase domain-containing protein [Aureimonas leprariae]|uniref:Adenylate/guanylate cyclase domain-containing protein n=1 Tax=Plantimonas leprariae TaxID=2615207 RepID=A0A7V7PP25_9HYPH|nr:adenylate/guanylate cyclase domain-containing protein [Aureimonas leprariae]KAB0679607.1 adenylate/guanylate cyclase domain-containing protein [Aureimonas leprariae]
MQLSSPPVSALATETGSWPSRRHAIIDWLVSETRGQRFIDNLFVELCERLRAAGVPVARAGMFFRVQHPQWVGASMLWKKGATEAELDTYEAGSFDGKDYTNSPIKAVHRDGAEIRRRLRDPLPAPRHFPIFDELEAQGYTEYVAWPLDHTLDRRHVVTFAADGEDGFGEEGYALLRDLVPVLALVSEIRLKNRFARTLLETYVGPHASAEILAGAITRGSGATVGAAIMICDLRDFTRISEAWPRDDVIELLNGYFDAISEPIEKHGGEILKFIGDGLLAIFPLDQPDACRNLLRAVAEGQKAMAALNEDHVAKGREPLSYGVGIHVGDVMYGNIGSRKRLDFTVIGPAVNTAARLETLTKTVKRQVLLSKTFAEMAGCQRMLESLGAYPLRGHGEPVEVFAFFSDRCRADEMAEQAALEATA